MLFFAMVLQRFCSWGWGEWSGWVAWEKSVVAGCAVFCNGSATFLDERVKKVRCEKRGGARRTAFATVLFDLWVGKKTASAHLRHPKWTLYCFLQGVSWAL